MRDSYRIGRLYHDGVVAALIGATNAGKSSLFNLLARQDRAIVSQTPGTTRDWIETRIDIEGIPIRLYDTAGLRSTQETIENEGMRRSREIAEHADLLLYVIDGTQGITADDHQIIESSVAHRGSTALLIWNKIDCVSPHTAPPDWIACSAVRGDGIAELRATIGRRLLSDGSKTISDDRDNNGTRFSSHDGTPHIDSLRQKRLIEQSIAALNEARQSLADKTSPDTVALDIQEAIQALGEITGEVTSDDILNAMFNDFCVGK